MRKYALLFILAISVSGTTSFAGINDNCPLKNLRKNQLRGSNKTAFIPSGKTSVGHNNATYKVSARN